MTREVSIPEQGAALIGWYWDESARVRIDYPEKGPVRNEAFRELKLDVVARLRELGLTYVPGLPSGKASAMRVAYERFTRELEARPPSRR